MHVEAGIDLETGLAVARFATLDPATGWPPEVSLGFLPPEDGTGRGQGFFSYLVDARPGLPTGTEIRNVAVIQFDFGETIATNQVDPHDPGQGVDPAKECLNTIDAGAPASSVIGLPETIHRPWFEVRWAGEDDPGGSGIASYDVYAVDGRAVFLIGLKTTHKTPQDHHRDGRPHLPPSASPPTMSATARLPRQHPTPGRNGAVGSTTRRWPFRPRPYPGRSGAGALPLDAAASYEPNGTGDLIISYQWLVAEMLSCRGSVPALRGRVDGLGLGRIPVELTVVDTFGDKHGEHDGDYLRQPPGCEPLRGTDPGGVQPDDHVRRRRLLPRPPGQEHPRPRAWDLAEMAHGPQRQHSSTATHSYTCFGSYGRFA